MSLQDQFMFKSMYISRSSLAALLSLLILASACESDKSASSAEQEAAKANVEAMAKEHANDTTDPSAAAQVAPLRSVISDSRIAYAEVDDELVYGHFVFPSDMIEPLPAVIMIHEWWGLNDNIRAMADRLAGEGYIVLAIDLYGGQIAENAEAARQQMLAVVEQPDFASENIRQAYAFLSDIAGAPRIGSLGWCFGGGWSLNTAILFPEDLDAAVIYYGQVTDDVNRLLPLNVPILGLFGAEDTGIPVASVEAFEAALQRLRKDYDIQIYPGVGHAFANPTGDNYSAEVAEDAWKRTLEFLGKNLVKNADET
jgi:carboxymethylenebutenolidase